MDSIVKNVVPVAPPRGVRGLKYILTPVTCRGRRRTPSWGAWIEIFVGSYFQFTTRRTPSWGAWIEMTRSRKCWKCWSRTPSWGAWIEIQIVTP